MTKKWIVPVAVSSLLLLLFFWFKIIRFQALYYTFNDMYIFLQASHSWMNGRPILYENIGGYDDRIHNNYGMLLMGPLIYAGGAYGAFIIQTGLSLLSYGLLLRQLSRRLPTWALWLVLVVLLLGPVWFWFNEHPNIGWHPELTYLPLSLLFLLALLSYQTGWIILTAALIVLIKEDGPLFAGAIHLSFLSVQYLLADRQRSIFGILTQPRFWIVLGSWAALFMAGMFLLSYKNRAAQLEPRLQQSLNVIAAGINDPVFIRNHLILLLKTFLLLLPSIGLLLYGLYRMGWRQAGSILLIYGVVQLALLLSNWVQGATYYGTNMMFELVSITWPPRFVLTYAFSVVYTLIIWFQFEPVRPTPAWQPVLVGVLLFVVQWPIAEFARPDFRLVATLRDTFTHRYDPLKEPLLPASDVAVAERLANAIPEHSSVFIFDYLIPFFHKHYNIWPTEKHWEDADVAIIPNNDFQNLTERLPRVMKQPLRSVRLSTYTIYYTPAYAPYVTASLPRKPEPK